MPVGFDLNQPNEWCFPRGISLIPMSYDRDRHRQMIKEFCEAEAEIEKCSDILQSCPARKAVREKAITYMSSLAISVKGQKWQSEQEWRILVIQPESSQTQAMRLHD